MLGSAERVQNYTAPVVTCFFCLDGTLQALLGHMQPLLLFLMCASICFHGEWENATRIKKIPSRSPEIDPNPLKSPGAVTNEASLAYITFSCLSFNKHPSQVTIRHNGESKSCAFSRCDRLPLSLAEITLLEGKAGIRGQVRIRRTWVQIPTFSTKPPDYLPRRGRTGKPPLPVQSCPEKKQRKMRTNK